MLLGVEAGNGRLQDAAKGDFVDLDEGVEVHVGEEAHNELAVHTVRHAAVSWDRVAKVLNLEGALETRSEETAERSDERRKGGQGQGVQLHRRKREREVGARGEEEELRELPGAWEEDGVYVALQTSKDIGAKVLQVGLT